MGLVAQLEWEGYMDLGRGGSVGLCATPDVVVSLISTGPTSVRTKDVAAAAAACLSA